ncbi:MAG: helix-turn-helix transcriptional regulator [Anaerolineales bacterium]|nr:helix-turn-helix transcriptional regulator [Anaerolineales bacterium]
MTEKDNKNIKLIWDNGTAYDMFASLHVLHNPDRYGLRRSWAAGVRSRLPEDERKFIEEAVTFLHYPLTWIHSLPQPKDGETVLWSLGQIPASERLPKLDLSGDTPEELEQILREVSQRGNFEDKDIRALREIWQARKIPGSVKSSNEMITTSLKWWSRPTEFGERYLGALRAYQQVFFSEEEAHIKQSLSQAIEKAKEKQKRMVLEDLLEDLSQGVWFTALRDIEELVLAPSYWSSPLVAIRKLNATSLVIMFGARPPGESLIPGEMVPEQLLRALKSLADPTRMRILRYLKGKPHSPAELARRLRLRAPTVSHHLNALRLAGLVQIILEPSGERRYSARKGAVTATIQNLREFLEEDLR